MVLTLNTPIQTTVYARPALEYPRHFLVKRDPMLLLTGQVASGRLPYATSGTCVSVVDEHGAAPSTEIVEPAHLVVWELL